MSDRLAGAARWSQRLLVAIGGLAVLGIAAIVLVFALDRGARQEPARVTGRQADRTFVIGDVERIEGTRLRRITVATQMGGGSYSYSADDRRNVVVLDPARGRSWRLLPDNNRRIVDVTWFADAPDAGSRQSEELLEVAGTETRAPQPTRYYLMRLARDDGGEDLVAGTIDGQRRGVLAEGVEGVQSAWMEAAGRLGLILRQGGTLHYRLVDMATFATLADHGIEVDR